MRDITITRARVYKLYSTVKGPIKGTVVVDVVSETTENSLMCTIFLRITLWKL